MTRADRGPAGQVSQIGGGHGGTDDLEGVIASLALVDVATLRAEWRRLYRAEPPKKLRRDTLQLAVAWQLQARVLGGLPGAVTRQLTTLTTALADGSELPKWRRVSLKPGARLVRHWGGQTHEIIVGERGFMWRDRSWTSLSVIAREITGARWSGPRFFGLDRSSSAERGRRRGEGADAKA
ncbi:MAG: hypothetical protein NVS3B2_06020 [Ramlibacter sp.]